MITLIAFLASANFVVPLLVALSGRMEMLILLVQNQSYLIYMEDLIC